ncbi:uracil-DNA glycosylase family protein [Echinicola marina]|uniref:uracil-DNA glycosylase family protein n=1 Tax=Echinicola marina TaxID=2859768 RepID=UPI001CF6BD72|nr:uracil-DNA glycosylase family protein [Echinicola marina]UCS94454.1 uracil-DNA glycosylase family protein [Echinicola marina]
MDDLICDIKACELCKESLPLGPNPILSGSPESKIVIIGQAPGKIVHETGIPWNDKSGDNLRKWLGVERDVFYDADKIALVPMGFCYPGRGRSGDLPPRPECAPLWHPKLLREMKHVALTILVGAYAQGHYLQEKRNLTDIVKDYKKYLPDYFPLPHPSPRNNIWQAKNPWFGEQVLPALQKTISEVLG